MDWSSEDRLQRERLERQSSGGQRLRAARVLNAIAAVHTAKAAPDGFAALNAIRKRQRLARRSSSAHNASHVEFTKAVAAGTSEGFNRLFPRHKLAAASVALVPPDRIGPDDARNQRFTPDLTEARRLLDAVGRLTSSDRRVQDHWSTGKVEAIAAQFLLDEARRRIAEIQAQTEREAEEDRVSGRIPLRGRG
jgi:hypothetical protein